MKRNKRPAFIPPHDWLVATYEVCDDLVKDTKWSEKWGLMRGGLRPRRDRRSPKYRNEPMGHQGSDGYAHVKIYYNGKTYSYRYPRLLYLYWHGTWPPDDLDIDHLYGKRADNRYEMLRPATRKQNMANKKSRQSRKKKRGELEFA